MSFNINNRWRQGSRYLRRGKSGAIGVAVDLTVTPAFPSLGTVAGLTATAAATGGTLSDGAYSYKVSALNARGESLPSAAASDTVAASTGHGSVALAWTAKAGALTYNVYRGNLFLVNVATNAYLDTGALTPAGAINAIDTTAIIPGAVPGQVNAGDMVYRTSAGVASLNSPGTANANAAFFLGVAEDAYPLVLGFGEGVTLGKPAEDPRAVRISVRQSGEFGFDTTPNDVYHPGDLVYVGADAQTVTTTSSGTAIGKVADDQSPVLNGSDGFSVVITGGIALGGLPQRVNVEITPPLAAGY